MRYYWLRDQRRLQLFNYYWRKGDLNLDDYCSKHFPATHHVEQKKIHRVVDGLCQLSMLSLRNKEKIAGHLNHETKMHAGLDTPPHIGQNKVTKAAWTSATN